MDSSEVGLRTTGFGVFPDLAFNSYHMSKSPLSLVWIVVCSLAACIHATPTPYQPKAAHGGYTDSALDDSTFVIAVVGNAATERVKVLEYFHRRAKELCTSKGFTDYRVLEQQATSNTTGSVHGGDGSVETSPEHSGRIRCTKAP